MFSRFLALNRYTLFIPVIGAWLASLLSMGFGLYEVVLTVIQLLTGVYPPDQAVKASVINLVEGVDLFLLGTAFYLISLGLYELFIDANAPVPSWLEIHDLNDLKNKLISVVVVVLAVQFLARVLNWKGEEVLLPYGLANAAVIAALAFFIAQRQHPRS